jgi:membrane protease YdiL (CAAX protease family)
MKTRNSKKGMTVKTLWPFFTIAFGLSWGLMSLYFAFPDELVRIFGPVGYTNPLFVISVYAPAIAGLALTLKHSGLRGLGSFLKRLTLWRMPARWWAFIVLGIPAVFYAGAVINGNISDPFPFTPWYKVLPALAIALAIGPMEEFGWRGVALPLLQRKFAPIWASLILGGVWGLWHLPAFFMEGTPQSAWSFGPFFLGTTALAVILTQMFNSSRGSLLVAALYHFQLNGPIWPDAQPWDSVMLAVIAVIVVVVNRKAMFTKGSGVTEVLSPDSDLESARSRAVTPSTSGASRSTLAAEQFTTAPVRSMLR